MRQKMGRLADILKIRYSEYTISDIQADILNIRYSEYVISSTIQHQIFRICIRYSEYISDVLKSLLATLCTVQIDS